MKALSQEPWMGFFGADYLLFSEVILSPERTAFELNAIEQCLELTAGMRILDLGCGQGRMSMALAKKGLQVTGIDASVQLLDEAKRRADEAGLSITFLKSDMRELDFTDQFDAVINIGTAFGYIPHASEDQDILNRIKRSLKPGGCLLQDTENRDFKLQQLRNTWDSMNDRTVFSRREFDSVTGRWAEEISWYEQGDTRSVLLNLRLYTATELIAMTELAGLKVEQAYGGFDLSKLTVTSPRMLILSRKGVELIE